MENNIIPIHSKKELKNMPPKRLKVLIGGPSKIGKSTFLDNLSGKVLFLNTDGNTAGYSQPHIKINLNPNQVLPNGTKIELSPWEYFKTIVNELAKKDSEGKLEYDWVVIDLLPQLYDACRWYSNKKNGISHESDLGFGKAYDFVKSEFRPTMEKFYALNCSVAVVVLTDEKNTYDKTGNVIETREVFNLPDKILQYIDASSDLTMRIYEKEFPTKNADGTTSSKKVRIIDWNSFGIISSTRKLGGYRLEHIWEVETTNPYKIINLDAKEFEATFFNKK